MMLWSALLLLLCYSPGILGSDEIVQASAAKVTTRAGEVTTINIAVSVKNGYHIQANKVNDEFIIPTTVELTPTTEIKIKKIVFPSSKKFKLEGVDDYLEVYDGNFEIAVKLKTAHAVQRGTHQLEGRLKYQACDSVRCFSPKDVRFLVELYIQ